MKTSSSNQITQKSIVPYLVKRFLRFDNNQPFIFLSALLAFMGITLGVMVLIIAMGLMNGFDDEFKKKLTVMNYPLTIIPRFYGSVNDDVLMNLEQKFPDLSFSSYIHASVIARNGANIEGGYLFGVNFDDEIKVNRILKESLVDENGTLVEMKKFDVLVGKALKETLNVHKNRKITYIFTEFEPGGLSVTPKIKRFKSHYTYDSGLAAYDKAYSYTTIESLQKIMHMPSNQYDGIHIFSEHPQEDLIRIQNELDETLTIRGWWEDNLNFFAALEMEKTALFIVLMLIILIASINIISSLLMTVMNRRSDIALLLSLGASSSEIKRVFLYLGVVIGIGGIFTGVILGLGGTWILSTFDIISLPKDVYPTSTLPIKLELLDLVSIVVGAFFIVVASAYYPAKKASEVDILTVLRNE
jgi:putative ABC transport system permease protein